MAQEGQKSLSITEKTWNRISKQVNNSGYNTTSGLAQHILNMWCDKKESENQGDVDESSNNGSEE